MPDELDLTAELDAAEDIVTGRVAKVETEWGWREPGRAAVFELHLGEAAARAITASRRARGPVTLVRRTVTYGEWEAAE